MKTDDRALEDMDVSNLVEVRIDYPHVFPEGHMLHGLKELQYECWKTAENHGFHDAGQSFGDKLMLMVSEASEALEAFREGHAPGESWYDGAKICGIPSELADIIIRVLDTAEGYGIDLAHVIENKMAYNETRPFMHGKVM